jgi:hypothetical protein
MRFADLVLICALATLHLFLVAGDITGALRVTNGFVFMALFPGYAILSALMYRPGVSFVGFELVALSMPLSVAVVALLGLILNHIGVGADASTHAVSIWIVITTASSIGAAHRASGLQPPRQSLEFLALAFLASGFLTVMTYSPQHSVDHEYLSMYVVAPGGIREDGGIMGGRAGAPIIISVAGTFVGEESLRGVMEARVSDDQGRASAVGAVGSVAVQVGDHIELRTGEEWAHEVELQFDVSGTFFVELTLRVPGAEKLLRELAFVVRVE